MKYERFEDLPVWQAGQDLAVRVHFLTDHPAFDQPGDLVDQLRRSSLSVSSNIAEGFERGSTAELLAFLYISRGSAGETRSHLRFAHRLPRCSTLKSEVSDLISLAESCSRQLRAWTDSLQNSDIQGPRHLNDQTRAAYNAHRRAAAFLDKLDAIRKNHSPNHPPDTPYTNASSP